MYSQNGEKGSFCYGAERQFNQMSAKREATRALKSASDKDFNVALSLDVVTENKTKQKNGSDHYDSLSICHMP